MLQDALGGASLVSWSCRSTFRLAEPVTAEIGRVCRFSFDAPFGFPPPLAEVQDAQKLSLAEQIQLQRHDWLLTTWPRA